MARYWQNMSFKNPQKILFFRFDDCLGDSIIHSFFLRELKKLFPQASITVTTFAPSQHFFSHHTAIDHIITLPPLGPVTSSHRYLRWKVILALLKMLLYNWRKKYDLTILNVTLPTCLNSFYCHLFFQSVATKFDYSKHITFSYVSLLQKLGAKEVDTSYLFSLNQENIIAAQNFLRENSLLSNPFWVLNPVGSLPSKQLSLYQLQFIIEKLRQANFQTVLLDYKDQFTNFPDTGIIRYTSKSVFETAAIIKQSAGVISTDTGIVHIADSFNKKLLVLYTADSRGPYKRSFWASRNYPANFIQSKNTVASISTQEIDTQLKKILSTH